MIIVVCIKILVYIGAYQSEDGYQVWNKTVSMNKLKSEIVCFLLQ